MQFRLWLENVPADRPLFPEEEGFINAIKANPNDVSLWLVYADWLEEHGDMEQSQRIRQMKKAPVKRRGMVNHRGEHEFINYNAWRRAILAMFPTATFDGNKDIAQALFHGRGIGEWDGEVGTIYS